MHAYGYLAPPKDKDAPALVVGVWMGNSNNAPNKGSLSLDSSAPLWSAIIETISKDMPIASFKAPSGLKSATVDAFTGLKPGPFTKKTVRELFLPGTVPNKKETIRISLDIDEASGLLWQDGCVGPKVTKGFFDLSEVESNFPAWQKANRGWAARAAKGPGVRGLARDPHVVLLPEQLRAVRSLVGRPVRPQGDLPAGAAAVRCPAPGSRPQSTTSRPRRRSPAPRRRRSDRGGGGGGGGGGGNNPTPKPTKPPKPAPSG